MYISDLITVIGYLHTAGFKTEEELILPSVCTVHINRILGKNNINYFIIYMYINDLKLLSCHNEKK